MGAQAAALLDAGGPVGDVPPPAPVAGRLRLTAPRPYDLDRVARSHGGVGLAPSAYDGERLHRVLRVRDQPVAVVVSADLTVTWSRPGVDEDEVRRQLTHALALDDDLEPLWAACDRVPSLAWVRPAGAGRLLRAPTPWEDLVAALASTNTSYASARRMLARLVGDGAFPTPQQVAAADVSGLGWGYRARSLVRLAELVAAGDVDPAAWLDPSLPDDDVLAALRRLPGFGPFAAAQVLPLLGPRPRPVVLDGWLAGRLGPGAHERFAAMGRWAGSGMWLEVTAARGRVRAAPEREARDRSFG